MDFFAGLVRHFQNEPILQGIVAALCTFILEDPTTVGSGLLVADGKMTYTAAFLGLSLGIAGGDFGLYLMGRLAQSRVRSLPFMTENRLVAAELWFKKNAVTALVAARFLPGMRLPTYVAAGILRVRALTFLVTAVCASVVWTLILLQLTITLGETALAYAGRLRWPLGIGLVVALAVIQIVAARKRRKLMDQMPSAPPVASLFEFWPPWLFYPPVALYCLWLGIRHRGLTLPTAANPSIYSGGFVLESKSRILELVPPKSRKYVAPWTVCEVEEDKIRAVKEALAAMEEAGLDFPVVAKPDIGQRGAGVRPVAGRNELADYIEAFPPGEAMVIQQLADYPLEAGILWCRLPSEEKGKIISVTAKLFPKVVGDGERTLRKLILADSRARLIPQVYFKRHAARLDEVIPEGEELSLVFSGNHAQGAIFENGQGKITDHLAELIEKIATSIPEFWFGRFDIRFQDWESFGQGENFLIVEVNGASSESTHIWDRRTKLRDAYKDLFTQFRLLYKIGAENRARGHKPLSPWRVLADFRAYNRKVVHYPTTR